MEVTPEDKKILDAIRAELLHPTTTKDRRDDLIDAWTHYSHKYCFDWLDEADKDDDVGAKGGTKSAHPSEFE